MTLSIGDESLEELTLRSEIRLQYSAKLDEKILRNNTLNQTYRFNKMSFHAIKDCVNQDRLTTIIYF